MSDDLIKRYDVYHIYDPVDIEESHDGKFVYYSDYQARIEQLERENYQLIASLDMTNFAWDQAFHQRDEAEAKLSKAVEAIDSRDREIERLRKANSDMGLRKANSDLGWSIHRRRKE